MISDFSKEIEQQLASKQDGIILPRGLVGRQGIPLAPGGRLPSFRAPRDLTLGMNKALTTLNLKKSRKTYVPNIPPKKDKNEIEINDIKSKEKQTSNKANNKREDPRRERHRAKPELIQTPGSVFCDGINSIRGDSKIGSKSTNHVAIVSHKESHHSNKSKINMKKDLKASTEEEDELKDLFRDDFVSDWDKDDNTFGPIQLPLNTDKGDKLEILGDVKTDIKPIIRNSHYMEGNLSDLFIMLQNKLTMFQFPDSLPGLQIESNQQSDNEEDGNGLCPMKALPEGLIGKIHIHKSGKMVFVTGDTHHKYLINEGVQTGFQQNVVSVDVNESNKAGDIMELGQAEHSLICTPDLQSMIKNRC